MKSARPLYFDNNATTPLDPRVLEAMMPYFREDFGNPESGGHAYGWKAESAVNKARAQVAQLLGADKHSDIIFTSGATESMNLAILGLLEALGPGKRHIITTNAEHKATLNICARAEKLGHDVTYLPVDRYGQVTPEQVVAALKPHTALVSILHANNEIGSINPVAAIGQALRSHSGIAFHVDAAQTAGKVPINVHEFAIDLLSLSAHKFYGPKGTGALYARRPDIHLSPIIIGGGQERGLRGGTHNVPGIVGLGEACALAAAEMGLESERLTRLRNQIIDSVSRLEGVELNGDPKERVCNNVHFTIRGLSVDQLLTGLSDIAFSTASACSAGGESHVLKAIGRASSEGVASMRFGLGRFTQQGEVETLIRRLSEVVTNARGISKT